jgi:hypothetical protein
MPSLYTSFVFIVYLHWVYAFIMYQLRLHYTRLYNSLFGTSSLYAALQVAELYCCFTAALLLLYCCFTAASFLLLYYSLWHAALLQLMACCFTTAYGMQACQSALTTAYDMQACL